MSVMTITIFIAATFFTQITMLNMLIAIMSDTFEKVFENYSIYIKRTTLSLLADYAANIRTIPTPDELTKKFLFVISPEVEEERSNDSWYGTVHQIQKHMNLLQKKNVTKLDQLKEKIDEKILELDASMTDKNLLVSNKI